MSAKLLSPDPDVVYQESIAPSDQTPSHGLDTTMPDPLESRLVVQRCIVLQTKHGGPAAYVFPDGDQATAWWTQSVEHGRPRGNLTLHVRTPTEGFFTIVIGPDSVKNIRLTALRDVTPQMTRFEALLPERENLPQPLHHSRRAPERPDSRNLHPRVVRVALLGPWTSGASRA
jgi:hypothetical protein